MNRTWSIILIVVACIAILGGTYWFFEMRTPAVQESQTSDPVDTTPSEILTAAPKTEPAQTKPLVAPASPTPSSEQPIRTEEPVIEEEKPSEVSIAEVQREETQMPPPISPIISNGSLRLPPLSAGIGALPVSYMQKEEGPLPEKAVEEEGLPVEMPSTIATTSAVEVTQEGVPENEAVEQILGTQEAVIVPEVAVAEEIPIEEPVIETVEPEIVAKEAEQESFIPIPKAPTITETKSEIDVETLNREGTLSVSFLNFNYPGANKVFSANFDFLIHQDSFAYGGTLEVGRITNLNELQVSLLGKVVWTLGGENEVTFPLSISLGPTMFYDTDVSWGLTARINAGINYEITDSLWFFYSVGAAYQLNITDMAHRFVLEPMRMGFGIRF